VNLYKILVQLRHKIFFYDSTTKDFL